MTHDVRNISVRSWSGARIDGGGCRLRSSARAAQQCNLSLHLRCLAAKRAELEQRERSKCTEQRAEPFARLTRQRGAQQGTDNHQDNSHGPSHKLELEALRRHLYREATCP